MAATRPEPACVVDVDEESRELPGTRRSASTRKVKVSHRGRRTNSSEAQSPTEESSRRVVTLEKESKRRERRNSITAEKSPQKERRPPSAHGNRGPSKISGKVKDDPSNYGIPSHHQPALVAPIPLRPRAMTTNPRPVSYHASTQPYPYTSRPPISSSAYYNVAAYTQPQYITPSYPPPSPSYMTYAAPTQQQDYFTLNRRYSALPPAHSLSTRFEPISRTASAYGVREAPQPVYADSYQQAYYDDSYASSARSIRTPSRPPSRVSKAEQDAADMPPPPRPGILRRRESEVPTSPLSYEAPDPYAHAPRTTRYRDTSVPRRPPNRNSVSYDFGTSTEGVRIETANNGRRRQSYYGQSVSTGTGATSGSSGYEDKVREAASYQQDVQGPSPVPLTADLLRRAQRRHVTAGGSSRSTKSSTSRDDSDYRKSATTRTTRSGSGGDDENVTIKVTGQARVMVGGAQIDCVEGGEIEIKRSTASQSSAMKTIRNGSERSGSEYGDRESHRRGRGERSERESHRRPRMSSTHSYTRLSPTHLGGWI